MILLSSPCPVSTIATGGPAAHCLRRKPTAVSICRPGWVSQGFRSAELSQAGWKFRTDKSDGSGDGVHGGGDAHAAAPPVPAPPHKEARWAYPSPAPSPPLVLKLPVVLMHGSPDSPWTAACACGRGLWTDGGGSGWVGLGEAVHLGFSSPCH